MIDEHKGVDGWLFIKDRTSVCLFVCFFSIVKQCGRRGGEHSVEEASFEIGSNGGCFKKTD